MDLKRGSVNLLIVELPLCKTTTYFPLKMNDEKKLKNKEYIENQNLPEKGPLNFIVGSLTSFLLCILFYFISSKIIVYFSLHKPSNTSEIVQKISTSINTLIIGLSFLLTFSFAFIGLGLFIVFIRSFLVKKI